MVPDYIVWNSNYIPKKIKGNGGLNFRIHYGPRSLMSWGKDLSFKTGSMVN